MEVAPSKKVISFSLWGKGTQYVHGACRNAKLALHFYPGWECWFYVDVESVPQSVIDSLRLQPNVVIVEKRVSQDDAGYMWRFEAIDDPSVEIMMSRDTDTRILEREQLAVQEWLDSGKLFHIMRDHPHQGDYVMAGMFGTKKIPNLVWKDEMQKMKRPIVRGTDQDFLRSVVYPLVLDSCLVHSSFTVHPGETAKKFPIDYDEQLHHVGGYIFANEDQSPSHVQELKKALLCKK